MQALAADNPSTAQALVRAHCSACHSLSLVEQQQGDAHYWRSTIRWMQQTQNLWRIPREQEDMIIDHLAGRYSATSAGGRRPHLSNELMFGPKPD